MKLFLISTWWMHHILPPHSPSCPLRDLSGASHYLSNKDFSELGFSSGRWVAACFFSSSCFFFFFLNDLNWRFLPVSKQRLILLASRCKVLLVFRTNLSDSGFGPREGWSTPNDGTRGFWSWVTCTCACHWAEWKRHAALADLSIFQKMGLASGGLEVELL